MNPTLAKTQNVHLFGDRIATFMFYVSIMQTKTIFVAITRCK